MSKKKLMEYILINSASMGFPDTLSLFVPIINHSQQFLQTTSCVSTELF